MNVAKESLDGFFAGRGSVSSPNGQILGPAYPIRKFIVIRSDPSNPPGFIYVLGPTQQQASVGNGYAMDAGEETPPIYIDDVSKIWVVSGGGELFYSWVGV